MLYKIVNKKHGNLSKKEKEKVLINAIEKNENEKTYKIDKRKNEIKNEISTYLETSNQIFIDGFIRFRLKEYFLHLEEIVEDSVKDYKIDKEYNGFIRLLQYFIKIQPSKLNVLHIVAKKNGTYNFYNKFLLNINNECKENLEEEILTNQINYDDFLISTVIVLSPKKIILHRSDIIKNKELISTLDKIFENKIKFCDGCNLCENDKI